MHSKTTLLTLAAAATAVSAQSVTLITGSDLPTTSLTDLPTLTGSWSNTIMPTDTSFTLSVPTWSPTHSFSLSLSRPTIFPTLPSSCSSVLADLTSIYSDVPTPPPVIGGGIPCSATQSWLSGTGPIPSAYSSYTSAASSWLSEHMSAISSAADQCTQLASLTSTITAATDMCSSTSTGSGSATTTTSGSSSGSGSSMSTSTTATPTDSSSSTSSTPTGAAARETGMVAYAAAFAVAGLVGAAAL